VAHGRGWDYLKSQFKQGAANAGQATKEWLGDAGMGISIGAARLLSMGVDPETGAFTIGPPGDNPTPEYLASLPQPENLTERVGAEVTEIALIVAPLAPKIIRETRSSSVPFSEGSLAETVSSRQQPIPAPLASEPVQLRLPFEEPPAVTVSDAPAPLYFRSTREYMAEWAADVIQGETSRIRGELGRSHSFGSTYAVDVALIDDLNARVLYSFEGRGPVARVTPPPGAIEIGRGVRMDAEMKISNWAATGGVDLLGVGATRPVCAYCQIWSDFRNQPIVTPRQPFEVDASGMPIPVRPVRFVPSWFTLPDADAARASATISQQRR
jgi:hypothetical protein